MRKLNLLLLLLFSVSIASLQAEEEEKDIKLEPGKLLGDSRSLVSVPTVTHDGSTLYLYSEVVMEEVVVTVKDLATGETIASGVVTLLPGGATVLPLPAADEGTFQIDITVGDNSYWGIFTI